MYNYTFNIYIIYVTCKIYIIRHTQPELYYTNHLSGYSKSKCAVSQIQSLNLMCNVQSRHMYKM